jgi:hypothetical protein
MHDNVFNRFIYLCVKCKEVWIKQSYHLFGTDPEPIGIRQAKWSPAEGHTTHDP